MTTTNPGSSQVAAALPHPAGGSRQRILAALRRAAPQQPLPAPDLAPLHAGPFGPLQPPADPVGDFVRAARGWRAEVLLARAADWPLAVQAALAQRRVRRVMAGMARDRLPPGDPGFPIERFEQPIEALRGDLFDGIEAGLTGADAGIALTGSLLLLPGPGEPRTLSLVPPLHIAVLQASRIHASLPAAAAALGLGRAGTALPTNVVMISGPSKTADIQQTLAYGAHGPKELVIVLVEDL